jgi:CheY-like chemotaxis protein
MPGNQSVRVLIVDDDKEAVKVLTDELGKLGGYEVRSPDGAGDALVQNTQKLAPQFRPHVVVLDLCFIPGSSDDYMGFQVIESLQSARIIPHSSYLTAKATARLHQMDVESWIAKGGAPTAILDAILQAADKAASCRSRTEIERTAAWDPAGFARTVIADPTVPVDLAADVLCRVFRQARRLTIEQLGASIVSSQTPVRGRSVVRTVVEDSRVPVIIKWALSDRIRQEWENYNRYVRGRLGGRYYPLAETHAEFWDLGCIVYSFFAHQHRSFDSFAGWYELDNSTGETAAPLIHLFRELWGAYYTGESSECRNLYSAYDDILELTAQSNRLRGRTLPAAIRALDGSLPDPLCWAHDNRAESSVPTARQIVTHGDLHADNFFVDAAHAWPIDFERTGPGPRLRDFAELEVDIVTRLVPTAAEDASAEQDLLWYLPLALTVAGAPAPAGELPDYSAVAKDPALRKARGVVGEIRKLAYEMTHYLDIREYLWNLLLDAAFVTSQADPDSLRYHRALLLGALLCQRLHEPRGKWPPKAFGTSAGADSPTHHRAGSPRPPRDRTSDRPCVFFSYDRRDAETVTAIAQRLETTENIPVWLDTWNLLPGDPWQEEIETALEQSRACAVFWGPGGPGTWQREEMRVALDRRARDPRYRVIPVLLPGARRPRSRLPALLHRVTWVDMREGWDDAFNRLVAGITGRQAGRKDA